MSLDSLGASQQKLLETVASAIGPCYYPLPLSAPPASESAVLLPLEKPRGIRLEAVEEKADTGQC